MTTERWLYAAILIGCAIGLLVFTWAAGRYRGRDSMPGSRPPPTPYPYPVDEEHPPADVDD